jgi:hypothetical protein
MIFRYRTNIFHSTENRVDGKGKGTFRRKRVAPRILIGASNAHIP